MTDAIAFFEQTIQLSKNIFRGPKRDRTADLLLARQALSQLSYGPVYNVGRSGLEPPASRLSGVCSNQLSYRPAHYQRVSRKLTFNYPATAGLCRTIVKEHLSVCFDNGKLLQNSNRHWRLVVADRCIVTEVTMHVTAVVCTRAEALVR